MGGGERNGAFWRLVTRLIAVLTALVMLGGIFSWISGVAWSLATAPMVSEFRESLRKESEARQSANRAIAERLMSLSRDRLDLVDVMMTAPGRDRDRKLSLIREKWAAEEKHREARP